MVTSRRNRNDHRGTPLYGRLESTLPHCRAQGGSSVVLSTKMRSETESRRASKAVQAMDFGLPASLHGLASAAPKDGRQLSFLGAD